MQVDIALEVCQLVWHDNSPELTRFVLSVEAFGSRLFCSFVRSTQNSNVWTRTSDAKRTFSKAFHYDTSIAQVLSTIKQEYALFHLRAEENSFRLVSKLEITVCDLLYPSLSLPPSYLNLSRTVTLGNGSSIGKSPTLKLCLSVRMRPHASLSPPVSLGARARSSKDQRSRHFGEKSAGKDSGSSSTRSQSVPRLSLNGENETRKLFPNPPFHVDSRDGCSSHRPGEVSIDRSVQNGSVRANFLQNLSGDNTHADTGNGPCRETFPESGSVYGSGPENDSHRGSNSDDRQSVPENYLGHGVQNTNGSDKGSNRSRLGQGAEPSEVGSTQRSCSDHRSTSTKLDTFSTKSRDGGSGYNSDRSKITSTDSAQRSSDKGVSDLANSPVQSTKTSHESDKSSRQRISGNEHLFSGSTNSSERLTKVRHDVAVVWPHAEPTFSFLMRKRMTEMDRPTPCLLCDGKQPFLVGKASFEAVERLPCSYIPLPEYSKMECTSGMRRDLPDCQTYWNERLKLDRDLQFLFV